MNDAGSNTASKDGYIITVAKEQPTYTPAEQIQPTPTEQTQYTPTEQSHPAPTEQTQYTPTEQSHPAPTEQPEPPSASVNLYGGKTNVNVGEDVLLTLSAVNLITKPTMHAQVIIIPPSGMSVSSSEFVESGAGQYTAKFDLEPGDGKDIEVRIKANQVGNFIVNGRVVYYFGDNKKNVVDKTLDLPIQVSDNSPIPTTTPATTIGSTNTSGFSAASLVFILLMVFLLKRD
jgi:hypothetical protein